MHACDYTYVYTHTNTSKKKCPPIKKIPHKMTFWLILGFVVVTV